MVSRIILVLLSFQLPVFIHSQYCENGGPTSNSDSNVESVIISGQSGQINHLGCPSQIGVEVYLNESVTLSAGSNYSLQVDFGTCGGNYASAGTVWIDFDQSGAFTSNEVVGTWTGIPPVGPTIFSVVVPMNAHNGMTRMRVTQQEAATLPLNPCATFQWGSVMDFGINIVNGLDCSGTLGDVLNEAINVPSLPFVDSGDLAYCYGNQNLVYNSPDVYYKLNLNPTQQSIQINSCGSNFDTYLSILNPQGQVIAYNDDGNSCSPASEVYFEVGDLGYVYIILEGWGNEMGLYQISMAASYVGEEEINETFPEVYPNPVSNTLQFSEAIDNLTLHDLSGKLIMLTTEKTQSIEMVDLPPGLYLLSFQHNGRPIMKKISKT